ncbi:amidohydrolase family protein [Pseudoalteromonas sp. JBTF-M23]|uniref:Amidohydrolase family protein n=1 Tax=Pseudoalteromonas caenipelagi TaxID=2726988 RepID=A0A849VIU0_9GAMM|nr:amidohydrolase family protein [Pseudoalteromonas caenipelagi]NOU52720.1 amidohydrolase family protein [Pseudoalteromonas caenipelagi]
MMPIIDPHLHFFDLSQGQYRWLTGPTPPAWPNLDKIIRDHGPEDLQLDDAFFLAGCVHIEAGFDNNSPDAELNWLAKRVTTLPYQAIAYLDITQAPALFSQKIKMLQNQPRFIGIRDITEGTDVDKLSYPNTQHNLAHLARNQLIFEAQFELKHEGAAEQFSLLCQKLDTLQVVINHSGFIEHNGQWQKGLEHMAKCKNVAIKYSGQEHVAKPLGKKEQLTHLLDAFTDERVMFASNYPVCMMRADYATLWRQYYQLVDDPQQWTKLSYANAKRIYQF